MLGRLHDLLLVVGLRERTLYIPLPLFLCPSASIGLSSRATDRSRMMSRRVVSSGLHGRHVSAEASVHWRLWWLRGSSLPCELAIICLRETLLMTAYLHPFLQQRPVVSVQGLGWFPTRMPGMRRGKSTVHGAGKRWVFFLTKWSGSLVPLQTVNKPYFEFS